MENSKGCVIVTWDFTVLSENAFKHGLLLSERLKQSIKLVHIVGKKKEVPEFLEKLSKIAQDLEFKFNVQVDAIVREGTIFKTINKVAQEYNASAVCMGTHGIKGMQKVTGSWALKVIVNSKIPYIVVQEEPKSDTYKKVLMVTDYKKENKQKVKWSLFVHKLFNSEFVLLKPFTKDKIFQKRISQNESFAKMQFQKSNVSYELAEAKGEQDFAIEIIEKAREINADLIMVMTTKNIGFTDYALGAHEQYVIANYANIPVMCINPDPDLTKYQRFM
jgi:nucleotide-binding universal stress UspA family protein